jgi:uncharacterized protein YgiM (DUF1202 family)
MDKLLPKMLEIAAELGVTDLPPYPMPPQKWMVMARGLNVRQGAGTDYEILRTLPFGYEVTILREENGWAEIAPNEWCKKEYLRKVS